MLIDSSHPEETRVVVVKGNRLEEFDFESQHKRQIRGNIYLAKVTRVEPSLQAAFVDYGGNRHGFLAFSEIHPDYYQIPLADRQALLEEEAALADAEAQDEDDAAEAAQQNKGNNRRRRGRGRGKNDDRNGRGRRGRGRNHIPDAEPVAFDAILAAYEARVAEETVDDNNDVEADEKAVIAANIDGAATISEEVNTADTNSDDETPVDVVAEDDDALEESRPRRRSSRKHYKIQEVIKRRQVILVQVVKEERGNKGAALTTYMSLAGRYSVLMPNTARGGGISRKITNTTDRKRLKDMVKELEVPKGMGVILRTAGANRTSSEVTRDYEYLMRLWDNVRDLTLSSSAPALVYEEGNLIKRSIRDLYNKDIREITVAGEAGFREAKDFMRMLMPSSAKLVKPWKDSSPIFARTGMEAQLDKTRRRGKSAEETSSVAVVAKGRDKDAASDNTRSDSEDGENADGSENEQPTEGQGKKRRRSRGRRGGRNRKNRFGRIPHAEVVGPMVEIAAAWDVANQNDKPPVEANVAVEPEAKPEPKVEVIEIKTEAVAPAAPAPVEPVIEGHCRGCSS
ncbi:Ribonuclease E [Nymphon striatum]|nr:Ribonuclease E [Nymphon striatum]